MKMKRFLRPTLTLSCALASSILLVLIFENVQKIPTLQRQYRNQNRGLICCGPDCRLESSVTDYYDEKYFSWQKRFGPEEARSANKTQKALGIQPVDKVAEFGSGSGYLLEALVAKEKWAVELNDIARYFMKETHFSISHVLKYPEDLPDGYFDIIFSIFVLEHVECPIQELRTLKKKLKCGGRLVVGVKNEGDMHEKHPGGSQPGNIHNHIWTWNEMEIANTVVAAGFSADETVSNPSEKDDYGAYFMYQFASVTC